jgi:phosphate uptake regulator
MSVQTPGPLSVRSVSAAGPRPSGEPLSSTPRRLQRMGAVTVGVSLPREWVGQRGLIPGRSVFLRTLPDGSLIVRDSERLQGASSAVLEVGPAEPGEHLFRRLIGAYLAGATEFVIRRPEGLTSEMRAIARTFARRTGQTESVSEEGTKLILRDGSMGSGIPIPQLLRRMFQVVYDLQVDSGNSWQPQSRLSTASLTMRDDDVDRFAWQIERGLRLSGWESSPSGDREPADPFRYLLWARDLERIGDHAVLIAEHGARLADSGLPEAIRRMLTSYHRQALEHLRAAQSVALEPDCSRANELLDVGEALHETQAALADRILMRDSVDRLPAEAIRSLGLVLQSIDRTTGYAQNLAEIGLDRDPDRGTHPEARARHPPLDAAGPSPIPQRKDFNR